MTNLNALVIEDDFDAANIFSAALKAIGLHVRVINNGGEARDALTELTPAVIILDMHLPEVAGTDILRQIRDADHLADTCVLVATADPRMAETVEDLADLVLLKPVTFSQVRDMVQRLNLDKG